MSVMTACANLESRLSNAPRQCDVSDLGAVFQDPLTYSGKLFCGEIVAYPESQVIVILPPGWPADERSDLVVLPERDSEALLRRVGADRPFRAYVRGRLDVMAECFEPSPPPGHMCLPFRRPIFIHLREARPIR